MGEEAEDVKPKIDLTINYEGQSQHPLYPPCVAYIVEWRTHASGKRYSSQRARSR